MTDSPKRAWRTFRLRGIPRLALGLFGFGLSSAGVIGVFSTRNDISLSVLLVVGALLSTFAIVGLLPVRFGLRGVEVQLFTDEVAEAVAEVAGTGPEAERLVEQATSALPPEVRDQTRIQVAAHVAFERDVIDAIARVAPYDAVVKPDQNIPEGWKVDAAVVLGRQRVYVEIRRIGSGGIHVWRRRAADVALRATILKVPLLFVVDRRPPEASDFFNSTDLVLVEWAGPQDDEVLRLAVGRALDRSGVRSLHDAMEVVLREAARPLSIPQLEHEIVRRKLYRPQSGARVGRSQIAARVSRYPDRFVRNSDGTVSLRQKLQ